MCNEIQCNLKGRPEPLSEEERHSMIEAAQRAVAHSVGPMEKLFGLDMLRWAATVAERDKRIALMRDLIYRMAPFYRAHSDGVRLLQPDSRALLERVEAKEFAKDEAGIRPSVFLTVRRGDPASHEAAQGEEEEGDGQVAEGED